MYGVRGSAAASIVLHCLGITPLDPVEHKLVFERFLNIERQEMPDIDLDFEDDRRDEVIAYISQKYGPDRVAQIITFGTMAARASVRDVGRVLDYPYDFCDRIAKMIPMFMDFKMALDSSVELRGAYNNDPAVKKLIDYALKMNSIVLIKRLGYALEQNKIDIYLKVKKHLNKRYDLLNPHLPATGKNNTKWKLKINEGL